MRVANSDWWASRKVVSVSKRDFWLRVHWANLSGPSSLSLSRDPGKSGGELTWEKGYGGTGGGIYNDKDGTLTVRNSTLSDNTAFNGGGLWNSGSGKVTATTFSYNIAADGAGIFNDGQSQSTLTVEDSSVSSNGNTQPEQLAAVSLGHFIS